MGFSQVSTKVEISCNSRKCGDILLLDGLLPCSVCRRCYHAGCCNPPVKYEIASRYSWLCDRCKYCFVCRNRGEDREHTVLICDTCDRAYHLECTQEQYKEVPEDDWHCDFCKSCSLCSSLLSSEELDDSENFTAEGTRLCRGCYSLRFIKQQDMKEPQITPNIVLTSLKADNSVEYCCVCSRTLSSGGRVGRSRVQCRWCCQGVHINCSERIDSNVGEFETATWMCSNCKYLDKQFV